MRFQVISFWFTNILAVILAGLLVQPVVWAVEPPDVLSQWRETDADRSAVAFWDAATGEPQVVANSNGRWRLINLWATWCAPCIKEMPALQRLDAAMEGQLFDVVTISLDRDPVRALRHLQQHELGRLPGNLDPTGAIMESLAVRGLPTSVLIDPNGHEVARYEGDAPWDLPPVIAFLTARIGAGR
jgi:thiol-disulfide isomerase/thioredoxin